MKKTVASLMSIMAMVSVAHAQVVPNASGSATAASNTNAVGGALYYAPTSSSSTEFAASSAIAPGLVAGMKTCSGSSSVGGSGRMISISFGSTWKDEDCQAGEFGQQLWNEGFKGASIGVLCSRDVIRYAIATTGGIPYLRKDGVVVHRACPMRQKDWEAAGEPLLDPISGTALTDAELNPPIVVKTDISSVGTLTDSQQQALLAKLSPEQKAMLAKAAKVDSIEAHAKELGAADKVSAVQPAATQPATQSLASK